MLVGAGVARRAEINALTGLRGLAALGVVLTHYVFWCAPWGQNTMPQELLWFFSFGDPSMTLFFTLSGFVIAYNYVDLEWRQAPLGSLLRFTWLRFSRLYPLLLIFLILVLNDAQLAQRVGEHYDIWVALHLLSVETWLPAQVNGGLPVNGTFSVSWSISTEFMLYGMFAAFMLTWSVFGRSKLGKLALLAAVVCYCAAMIVVWRAFRTWPVLPVDGHGLIEPMSRPAWDRWFFYQSPYFRIFNFALGALAALAVLRFSQRLDRHRNVLQAVAALSVAGLLGLYILTLAGNYDSALLQLAEAGFFALIMLNGEGNSRINRALSSRMLVGLGTISYSLYLMHPFIPRLNVYATYEPFDWTMVPHFVVNFSLALILLLAFSFGCYRYIELPAQQALRKLAFGVRSPTSLSLAGTGWLPEITSDPPS
jgi:peptidoglycan/LPS O-acetylase OafA/YrhL